MATNTEVLGLAQDAPIQLQRQTAGAYNASSVFAGLINGESLDMWSEHEKLLLSCLQTGDDKSALASLGRLISRFGTDSERNRALRGIYQEATAEDDAALLKVLHEYEEITRENPTNLAIQKRRIAVLRTLSKYPEAVAALVDLLEVSPNDIEAWSELSDLYLSQGFYKQAVFCLEEVLLTVPNAWNIHARVGEILLISSRITSDGTNTTILPTLFEAIRRYCRSVELCENYVRGLYGLKITTDRILQISKDKIDRPKEQGYPILSTGAIERLNEKVIARLKLALDFNLQPSITMSQQQLAELLAAQDLVVAR